MHEGDQIWQETRFHGERRRRVGEEEGEEEGRGGGEGGTQRNFFHGALPRSPQLSRAPHRAEENAVMSESVAIFLVPESVAVFLVPESVAVRLVSVSL
ncbi:uncharacterized protein DS421_2g36920 [Arachis hypogaea]|nr:uncharacterized protein DS421_2g36920 [Arachis hypogaea]